MKYTHEETIETNIGKIWFTVDEIEKDFGSPFQSNEPLEARMVLPAAFSIYGKALHAYYPMSVGEDMNYVKRQLLRIIAEVAVSPYEEDNVKYGILIFGLLMTDGYKQVVTFDTIEEANKYILSDGHKVVKIKPCYKVSLDGWDIID